MQTEAQIECSALHELLQAPQKIFSFSQSRSYLGASSRNNIVGKKKDR